MSAHANNEQFWSGTTDGAIGKYLRVTIDSNGDFTIAGDAVDIGTIQQATLAAGRATVRAANGQGKHIFVASEALATLAAPVYAAAGGKVASTGTRLVGLLATTAAADGDYVTVIPTNYA